MQTYEPRKAAPNEIATEIGCGAALNVNLILQQDTVNWTVLLINFKTTRSVVVAFCVYFVANNKQFLFTPFTVRIMSVEETRESQTTARRGKSPLINDIAVLDN